MHYFFAKSKKKGPDMTNEQNKTIKRTFHKCYQKKGKKNNKKCYKAGLFLEGHIFDLHNLTVFF